MKVRVGPTRTLDFRCVREQKLDKDVERILEGDFLTVCDCDQPIKIVFQVREHPSGYFTYLGYRSAEADLLAVPHIREHETIVDE